MRRMGEGSISARWLVEPGAAVKLSEIDARALDLAPGDGDKASAKKATHALRDELVDLQARLWAEGQRSLLVVIQAMDAGGKDGAIRNVFKGVNPQGCEVTSFKVPNEEELAHDFLWRVHKRVPAKGKIGIFNRSHYEDVLVVRVHDLVPQSVWSARYDTINDFEANLAAAGTRIVKFMLHISKEEQAERFRKRIENPAKRWKFRTGDLEERKLWDKYMAAFEDAVTRTTTEQAPWYVVPADHKWYRDFVITSVLVDSLRDMDPQFPEAEEDLDGVVVE